MESYEKLPEVTYLYSFGVILVITGHSYPAECFHLTIPIVPLCFQQVIYSFHMPLFTFLAGFLFIYTNNGRGKFEVIQFIKKKAKRIIIPYVVISSLAFVPKAFLGRYTIRGIDFSFNAYVRGIIYPLDNPIILFWFLPTLFIVFLVAPIFLKLITRWQKKNVLIITCTAIIALLNIFNPLSNVKIFNLSGVLEHLIYFWLGCLYYLQKSEFERGNNLYRTILALLLLILFNYYDRAPAVLRLTTALTGIILSLSLIQIYQKSKLNIFRYIDGYSYQIYLLQWFFHGFIRIVLWEVFLGGFFIFFFFNFFAGLIPPVITTKLARKYFPKLGIVIGL